LTTIHNQIASFIKYSRGKLGMTQEQLAQKAGVGLRFIRDIEQGKETLRMDKVNQVLALFGHQISPSSMKIKDPYEILINHFNRNVHISLKNKTELFGFIIESIAENNEIIAWKFITSNMAVEYKKTKDPRLEQIIENGDIDNIENI
jgi:y4mF family transcriptional regulator